MAGAKSGSTISSARATAKATAAGWTLLLLALALALASGCDEDETTSDAGAEDGGLVVFDAAATDVVGASDEDGGASASCTGEPDGTACDEDRHCVDGRCTFNTCGDGVKRKNILIVQ